MEHINPDMGGEDALQTDHMRALRYAHLAAYLTTPDLDDVEVESVARNYAESAQNVRTRWELYQHAEHFLDFEKLAISALNLRAGDTIVDVGTADGKFLYDIATMTKDTAVELHGVELSEAQLSHSAYWTIREGVMYEPPEALYGIGDLRAVLRQGSATDLTYYEDESVAAVSAMFMLYHLDAAGREAALIEFARILRPDGRLVIATSGINNKIMHRYVEHAIAEELSLSGQHVSPPRVMNRDFVSELLDEEFAPFKYVYAMEYLDHIVIDNAYTYFAYIGSLATMYDQFRPVPDREAFSIALKKVTAQIHERVGTDRPFIETVQRRLFICAHQPQDVPEDFVRLEFDDYEL